MQLQIAMLTCYVLQVVHASNVRAAHGCPLDSACNRQVAIQCLLPFEVSAAMPPFLTTLALQDIRAVYAAPASFGEPVPRLCCNYCVHVFEKANVTHLVLCTANAVSSARISSLSCFHQEVD